MATSRWNLEDDVSSGYGHQVRPNPALNRTGRRATSFLAGIDVAFRFDAIVPTGLFPGDAFFCLNPEITWIRAR